MSVRTAAKLATMQVALAMAICAHVAQALPPEDASPRTLSLEQGQALADFASRFGPEVSPKPDCSHLVHLLYTRAGLNYEYQDSRQLRRGVPEFVRVKTPQPGDLAVWFGHVGVVLSAEDKTFLSSVRSGIIVESWTNDYWSARGRPRFLRYVVSPRAELTLLAGVSSRSDDGAGDEENGRAASDPGNSLQASTSDEPNLPSALATMRQHSKPDKRDIARAFHEGSIDLSRSLDVQPMRTNALVSVVERVEVKQVKISHNEGSVRLKLTETLALEHGKMKSGSVIERELTVEQRDGAWVISDPDQRVYVLREQAEAVLEKQLRLKLQTGTARSDKRALVAALNYLYEHEPSGITRAEARKR
jgi:hypothetical protein